MDSRTWTVTRSVIVGGALSARRFAGRPGEFRWLGQLTFIDDTEFDPEAIRLSINELEQRGPGLVAYYRHQSGGQFISWVD